MNLISSPRILLTGANGFVGRALMARLLREKFDVVGAVRKLSSMRCEVLSPSLLSVDADWGHVLTGRDVVIHTAGRAHVLNDDSSNPLESFRKINTEGTVRLAAQAAEAGIKRFVFLSSIAVNGIRTEQPFTEADTPNPCGPYAISKWEAEQALIELGQKTNMEIVILRPPLVYGYDAPGNFGRLLKAVRCGMPLPLGSVIHNRRTFVALDNLVDLIVVCITHPAAVNQVFLVGDSEDLSTAELLRRIGNAMGSSACLIPIPLEFLRWGASLFGKADVAQRLLDNLQVNSTKARELLGWMPPVSVEEGLHRAVQDVQKCSAHSI